MTDAFQLGDSEHSSLHLRRFAVLRLVRVGVRAIPSVACIGDEFY